MTFYNDLKYASPPSPPPHQKNDCTVSTGMSASFVENIEGTGYWSASAVFDDEQFAFVQAGDNWLWNDRGLLCVDGESSPRGRIELFDDGLGGDDVAGDTRYTRSCLSICPGVLGGARRDRGVHQRGGDGSKLLGILSASLRGKISSRRLDDLSPTSHTGCESVTHHVARHLCRLRRDDADVPGGERVGHPDAAQLRAVPQGDGPFG